MSHHLSIRPITSFDDRDKMPLVSICVPTYNAEMTIVNTLDSILSQTYPNLEVIVVDNSSQDDTYAVVKSFEDSRIRAYRNPENIGAERNWNRCLELARGKYWAIFHADDLYRPKMVEKQVRFLEDNADVGAVFTEAYRINSSGAVIGEYRLPAGLSHNDIHHFEEILVELLKGPNFFICPSAMVRGEIYKNLAPFRTDLFGTSADLDMWLRIVRSHPVGILDEKLMCYRISESQGSNLYGKLRTSEADFFKVMDYHLASFCGEIPGAAMDIYLLSKLYDKHACALNYLIKGQPEPAMAMMKRDFLSTDAFRYLRANITSKPVLLLWASVIAICILTCFGLGVPSSRLRHRYNKQMSP
jgi:glycosyltransferase involved in cell wall biosynthesis